VTIGWDGFGISQQIWTMLVLIVATIITILILFTRKDYAYSVVIVWALIGIYLKRIVDDSIYGVQTQIAYTALFSIIIILAIATIFILLQNSKKAIQK
jgi:hypothetical protein